ncbi:MAG: cysteine synthase family protein [Erysipelotrichaceae bacterium]|jgi:cysteine synthase A|nr:cysteine synthase family protein [Erysipelotrichaceae bacterium]
MSENNQTIALIGNTPVYRIDGTKIYVKLEKFNVGGSVKDRTVWGMLKAALKNGEITKDTVLVEATSGNTGIALALLGAALKIPVVIVMPETMSVERRQWILAYGAELILTEGAGGMTGALAKQEALKAENVNYRSLSQFDNPANIDIHYETTGPEIYQQVPDVQVFVAGIGTGGTFTGVSRYLKEQDPAIYTAAVEPAASAVISGKPVGKHRIQGIGAGFVPKNYDGTLADEVITVEEDDAIAEIKSFAKTTGILLGISSGANIVAARKLAAKFADKAIVTVAPDGGEKYLSMIDFGQ